MARHTNFNKNEVLKNATTLFWRKGFHQTSIQDLVDTLGINRASIYNSYQDKYGLFTDCLTTYRNKVLYDVEKILSEQKTKKGFKNLFKEITDSIYTDINQKGCFVCNTYAEFLPSENKKINHFLDETKELWVKLISTSLKRGMINNEIKKPINIEITSHAIYASIVGFSILSKINNKSEDLKNVLNIHLEIFN